LLEKIQDFTTEQQLDENGRGCKAKANTNKLTYSELVNISKYTDDE
jgi:hypothetical protein